MYKPLLGSGSKLTRTLECPSSELLPATEFRSTGLERAASRGTAIHRYLQHAPVQDHQTALLQVDQEFWDECRESWKKTCVGYRSGSLREVRFIYNAATDTTRIAGAEYGELLLEEIPCTLDVCIVGYDTAEVWDYKTGNRRVSAKDNPQLLHGALCLSQTLAWRARYYSLGIQQLVKGTKKREAHWRDESILVGRSTLTRHKDKIRRALEKSYTALETVMQGGQPPVVKGAHCHYCPARSNCPAWKVR